MLVDRDPVPLHFYFIKKLFAQLLKIMNINKRNKSILSETSGSFTAARHQRAVVIIWLLFGKTLKTIKKKKERKKKIFY